ncbi:MAG: PEGA domain-containing protein, partial [Spirochaetaceae bacterium]|nr:PEGA domain-containing protein [Spirochaetaceae bacterium]
AFVSDPPGAEIFLDDQLVGISPLTLTLPGGKYKLLFRSVSREDVTRYVRLEGNAEILVELPPATESVSDRETYHTIIGPFFPGGEADEQINTLFVDTLEIVLEDDPRLTLIRTDIPWERMGNLVMPDYSLLEETGADLVVTGTFLKHGNKLVVQANLYDIQAESVKSGTFWTGEVGLSILDAMDLIAEKFMEEVDRVLPDAGRVLITRSEVVYGALSDEEQGISRKQLINRRWQEYPDSLNIQLGIGGVMQEGLVPMSMTPPISVVFDWSRDLSSFWQAGAGGVVHINLDRSFSGETTAPFVDLEAYGGARIMFRTLRTDMSFGLSGTVRFSPQFTNMGSTYGSFLSVGLPVDFRFNYYFTDTIERNPVYFITNISMSFVGYRFDLSGNKQHGFINMSGLIAFGVGMRL